MVRGWSSEPDQKLCLLFHLGICCIQLNEIHIVIIAFCHLTLFAFAVKYFLTLCWEFSRDQVEEISTFQLRNHLLNGCNIAVINEARNCLLRRIAKQETFMVCDPTISSLFQLNQSPDTLFYMGLSSVNHFKYDSCMPFLCYTEDWKQFTCHFCSHISGSQITFVSLFI